MKILLQTVAATLLAAVLFTGCKQSMVINRVDFSQPIESVLTPDEDGTVVDPQNGLKFNIKPIQYIETQDTSSVMTKEVRYIRGHEGFYYITAPDYKNVYVMAPEEGKLELVKKLTVSEAGIKQPALNQRNSYVQLLNQATGETWKLNPGGIEKEKDQMVNREED